MPPDAVSWTSCIPAMVVALAVLFLPGWLIAVAMGLRLRLAWGVAPLLSCAVVALAELLDGLTGLAFGPGLVVACTVGAVLLGLAIGRWRGWGWTRADLLPALNVAAATMAGLMMTTWPFTRAVRSADEFAQAPDILYHANQVRWALEQGHVNPFHFAGMGGINSDVTGFYPSLWHGLAALVIQLTGVSIPVVMNVLNLALTAVFAAGSITLAHHTLGRRGAVTWWSAILSGSFVAFPMFMFTWSGVLPNIVAISLFPVVLALLLGLIDGPRASATPDGTGPDDVGRVIDRPRLVILLVVAAPTVVLAHPITLFSALLMLWVYALFEGWRWLVLRRRPPTRAVAALVAVVAGVPALTALLYRTATVRQMTDFVWPQIYSVPQAVGQAVMNATSTPWTETAHLAVTALTLCGVLIASRGRQAWLVAAYVVWVLLYASTQSTDETGYALSGLWYHDRHRIAAYLVCISIPLATLTAVRATDRVTGWLSTGWGRALARADDRPAPGSPTRPTARPASTREHTATRPQPGPDRRSPASAGSRLRPRQRQAVAAASVVLTLGTYLAVSGMGDQQIREWVARSTFPVGNDNNENALITRQEQTFFSQLDRYVTDDRRVLNHAWDGTPLIYALTGVPVTSYSVVETRDPGLRELNLNIDKIATDPQICRLVNELDIGYVIQSGPPEFPQEPAVEQFAGIDAVQPSPSFERLASFGQSTLYRITACGLGPAPAG